MASPDEARSRRVKLAAYLRVRGGRGWGLSGLGPNEARVLFDIVLAAAAWIAAVVFLAAFVPVSVQRIWPTALLIPLFVIVNAAVGIYTHLKLASPIKKSAVLIASLAVTCALAVSAGATVTVIVLWALLTLPTAVVARLLLGLPYSQRPRCRRSPSRITGPCS